MNSHTYTHTHHTLHAIHLLFISRTPVFGQFPSGTRMKISIFNNSEMLFGRLGVTCQRNFIYSFYAHFDWMVSDERMPEHILSFEFATNCDTNQFRSPIFMPKCFFSTWYFSVYTAMRYNNKQESVKIFIHMIYIFNPTTHIMNRQSYAHLPPRLITPLVPSLIYETGLSVSSTEIKINWFQLNENSKLELIVCGCWELRQTAKIDPSIQINAHTIGACQQQHCKSEWMLYTWIEYMWSWNKIHLMCSRRCCSSLRHLSTHNIIRENWLIKWPRDAVLIRTQA